MKAAFTYTAIGILIVVVLIQIYYMNESYQDASGNVMDGSGNMVTLSLSDLFNAMRFNAGFGASPSSGKSYDDLRNDLYKMNNKPVNKPVNKPTDKSATAPTSGTWTGSGTWSGPSGASGSASATGNMSQLIVDRSTTQPPLPIPGACDAGSGGSCSCSGGGGSCSSGNDGGCSGYDNMSGGGAPFNMNEYIRKDSIPCYGCTLPQ
jgi:hypothetical protein